MTPEEREGLMKQGLPTWVSDDQWQSIPHIKWWTDRDRAAQSIARFKPVTLEEARRQAKNHR